MIGVLLLMSVAPYKVVGKWLMFADVAAKRSKLK